jgi:hypothetical protein
MGVFCDNYSTGICNVLGNTILGAIAAPTTGGYDGFNYGVAIGRSEDDSWAGHGRIERNVIFAGSGLTGVSIGIGIHHTSGSVEVVNNWIHGGLAVDSAAIEISGSLNDVWVVNNTLYAGGGSGSQAGIRLGSTTTWNTAARPIIVNNLFFGTGNAWSPIRQTKTGARPLVLQNNVAIGLVNAPAAFYTDVSSGSPVDSDVATIEATLCGASAPAASNTIVALEPNAVFVLPAGSDLELDFVADNDWHLLTSDTSITQAGRNTSTTACGVPSGGCPSTNIHPCGAVVSDIDNLGTRTTPYSVGADEDGI